MPPGSHRHPSDIQLRFGRLDMLLRQWQWVWSEVPFKQPDLSWYRRQPDWRKRLTALDDHCIEVLSDDALQSRDFARQELGIDIDEQVLKMPVWSGSKSPGPGSQPPDGIRPRKWAQVESFGAALADAGASGDTRLVEWCAGKGHLSRGLLGHGLGRSALALEYDGQLVEQGVTSARQAGLELAFARQDVLDSDVSRFCTADSHHVALHACGRLHVSMLEHCSRKRVPRIDLSPCCYHLTGGARHQALSTRARASSLRFDDDALKLAVQETATAPANARRQRIRQQQWRLGFDSLLRARLGIRHYVSVPSMSVTEAGGSFGEFCRRAASNKGISLPGNIDYARFEDQGRVRFAQVSREDLVRQLFRRPIELWLVYDLGLLLEERGYEVGVEEFCPRILTPRNLWIHARRPG
jgi:hypothetical protein